jgi:hypothetical protein
MKLASNYKVKSKNSFCEHNLLSAMRKHLEPQVCKLPTANNLLMLHRNLKTYTWTEVLHVAPACRSLITSQFPIAPHQF